MLFDYAMENDVVDKNYARIVKYKVEEHEPINEHIPFTDQEI